MPQLFYTALFIMLLLLYSDSVCLAVPTYNSVFDDMMRRRGAPSVNIMKELPKKGESSLQAYTVSTIQKDNKEEWAPLRIVVSSKDLDNSLKYCTKSENEQKLDIWNGYEVNCYAEALMNDEKKNILLHSIMPEAIKLHTDRLLVHPVIGPLVIPEFTDDICKRFTVPEEHHNPSVGVLNADFILYLAAGPSHRWKVPRAKSCAEIDNRPIAAVMNYLPELLVFTRSTVRIAAHILGHALGFTEAYMNKLHMVASVTNPRNNASVIIMNTTTVKAKAQAHYNCSEINGMELTNEGGLEGQYHWQRRNAKDELMSPLAISDPLYFIGYYTALTMSAFHDMGVYHANWGMEERMEWGRNTGCDFLKDKCMNNGITKFPNMFCNMSQWRCTSDRLAIGDCRITNYRDPLPLEFQYFELSTRGGDDLQRMEYCPIIASYSEVLCFGTVESKYRKAGSLYRNDSWCLDTDSLVVKHKYSYEVEEGEEEEEEVEEDVTVNAVCAAVKCDNGVVSIQYNGSSDWHECEEGKSITPSGSNFKSGSIKCPKYTEVCTMASNGSSLVIPPPTPTPTPSLTINETITSEETNQENHPGTVEPRDRREKNSDTTISVGNNGDRHRTASNKDQSETKNNNTRGKYADVFENNRDILSGASISTLSLPIKKDNSSSDVVNNMPGRDVSMIGVVFISLMSLVMSATLMVFI